MNILAINTKGGAGKTTTSTIVSSYLLGSTLIEVDKINKSAEKIKENEHFKSIQVDFAGAQSESFLKFENLLLSDGVKVIDIGATMLEKFHDAMMEADLYSTMDLVIIPAMDGKDDFQVAMKFLIATEGVIPPEKIMFAFSRYNNHEYSTVAEQFDVFFDNKGPLKKKFGIELNDQNYFAIQDSRAVKRANRLGTTVRNLASEDIEDLTRRQRAEKDEDKRMELTRLRSIAKAAQNFERDFVTPMMEKISKKLGV